MKKTLLYFALILSGLAKTAAQSLPASALRPYGRHLMTDSRHIEMIGSAVHFGFSFTGDECKVDAYLKDSSAHNYLQYELDGVYQHRVRIDGGARTPFMIKATKSGKHTVMLFKGTEATTGPIFIAGIEGKGLRSIAPDTTLPLIEFIGNSITCGAAADPSEVPCGTGVYHDQHNAYYAYGPRVARTLGVNYMLSGVSGIGIYRNWNSDAPTMPQVYEQSDLQLPAGRPWDFSRYTPRIVSIALGTNDFSNGDGKRPRLPFDSAIFVDTYIKFVTLVRSKYPFAQIALLSSPMVDGDRGRLLEHCISAVRYAIDARSPSGKRVAVYFFKPMQARGCGGHPNVEDHAILAKELEPFFKGLL